MNDLRRPVRSERAPSSRVATVAVTALAATIVAITLGLSVIVSYTNRFR